MPTTCVPQTSRSLLAILGVSLGLLAAGCPDPEGKFEDFGDRYAEINDVAATSSSTGVGGGTCDSGAVGDLDGEYLFALAANIGKKKPIVFAATLTTSDGAEGLEFSLDLQPLEAADRKTPSGPPITVGPFAIAANGSFDAQLPTLDVPGNANPISGSDLQATVKLTGGVLCQPADFLCGDVTGKATKPINIDLKGSFFTMTKVTGPDDYPDPVPVNCAKDPADPLK